MDSLTALALARELIDIDSSKGREGEAGRWLARRLRGLGYNVTEQQVDSNRFNVFTQVGGPRPKSCSASSVTRTMCLAA